MKFAPRWKSHRTLRLCSGNRMSLWCSVKVLGLWHITELMVRTRCFRLELKSQHHLFFFFLSCTLLSRSIGLRVPPHPPALLQQVFKNISHLYSLLSAWAQSMLQGWGLLFLGIFSFFLKMFLCFFVEIRIKTMDFSIWPAVLAKSSVRTAFSESCGTNTDRVHVPFNDLHPVFRQRPLLDNALINHTLTSLSTSVKLVTDVHTGKYLQLALWMRKHLCLVAVCW